MSRTDHHNRGKGKFKGYDKESSIVKKWFRRKRRHEGKRLLDDAPPEKGTQGWFTY